MLSDLITASHVTSMEQLPATVADVAGRAGLREVLIYVADLQQTVLRLLPGPDEASRDPVELRIEGTLAGRAFQNVVSARGHLVGEHEGGHEGEHEHEGEGGGEREWWVPLLDGTERIGVLHVVMSEDDATALPRAEALAGLIALMIVSKGPASDTMARLVRTRHMTVSAEMQWRLLPPMTFANDQIVISAALEPAYRLGGDTFDYGMAGTAVHLGVFDAMGHDTGAGLTSSLAVAAYRNSRVEGAGLPGIGEAIERALLEQDSSGRFVTAVLACLQLRTGMLSWVSYGHPAPVVIRGGRWVSQLNCQPGTPLGTDLGIEPQVCEEQLQPGDRVLLYTDGIVEARDPDKREFGLVRFVDFIIRRSADGLPVPETLRRLIHGILKHHAGRLDDDATVLVLEWHGPNPAGDGTEAIQRT
ncbi:serine/threonine-protein phosphatase [Actinomadura sp. WMMB 499]|nr:serine/threonine-protein phosphatase [Actinomadura sp. WMMB 499]